MNNCYYRYIKVHGGTWEKRITIAKAKKILKSGKKVRVYDRSGGFLKIIKPMLDWRLNSTLEELKRVANDKTGCIVLYFYIPIAWYDRFSGEKVEAFDTVRGLEEYNRDFEL